MRQAGGREQNRSSADGSATVPMPATGRGGSGRVGRGGVGEKTCEGFAPTGPAYQIIISSPVGSEEPVSKKNRQRIA
jgi:hypothetical protein